MPDDEGGGSTTQRPYNRDYGIERRREVWARRGVSLCSV